MDDENMQKLGPEADREVVRLWRAWRTVHEMCHDRGYELSEDEIRISLDEFRRRYTDPNTGMPDRKRMTTSFRPTETMLARYTPLNRDGTPQSVEHAQIGTIWIEFSADTSIGIKQMKNFAQHIHKHQFHTGILITQASLTAAALKIIPVVLPSIIETFQEQDLLVNITQHELVPRHILLSPTEKVALLQRYRLKESQLPRIQTSDPVARYLGLRRGQVVKIIRRSETAGRYASYRWVI